MIVKNKVIKPVLNRFQSDLLFVAFYGGRKFGPSGQDKLGKDVCLVIQP
jgi:hypothetical protein